MHLTTLLYIVVGIFLLGFLITESYTWFVTGVPTVTSWPSMRRKIIDILREEFAVRGNISTAGHIIDLGSGNGKLAQGIARALPQAHVLGIEVSFVPWLTSSWRQRLFGPATLSFLRTNFWKYDISNADAIVIYLNAKTAARISQKLKEMKHGALVVSNEVHLGADWQPIATHETGLLKLKVAVYRKG